MQLVPATRQCNYEARCIAALSQIVKCLGSLVLLTKFLNVETKTQKKAQLMPGKRVTPLCV